MYYSLKIEKMPKFVQEAYGSAQKKLTLLEGKTRSYITDTYSKLMENSSFKTVTGKLDLLKGELVKLTRRDQKTATENS